MFFFLFYLTSLQLEAGTNRSYCLIDGLMGDDEVQRRNRGDSVGRHQLPSVKDGQQFIQRVTVNEMLSEKGIHQFGCWHQCMLALMMAFRLGIRIGMGVDGSTL